MEFDLSRIEFSHQDKKRNIKLPTYLTEKLAELIGIAIGDGSAGLYKGKNYTHYEIRFYGHKKEDFKYYSKHVNKLFKKLFNINLKIRNHKSQGNASFITVDSKAIFLFIQEVLGISSKQKASISEIPSYIRKSPIEIQTAFLRGLVDTDSSLSFKKKYKSQHYYPVLSLNQKNKDIIKGVNQILQKLDLNAHIQFDTIKQDKRGFKTKSNSLYLSGKKNLNKWINLIGFNNPKHITKYLVWKKLGFCPPNTNLARREKIIKSGPEGI